MAQAGYTPIQLYYSTTAAAVPLAANLAQGELAINIADGKLYYENSSGVVTLLASAAGASGDVVGPSSATDNAVARFDGTTGKLIQNGVVIIGDTGAVTGVTDLTASGSVTLSGGTANGVTYLNGSKVVTSGSALTFDGTNALTLFRTTATEANEPTIRFSNLTFAGQNAGVVKSSNGGLALDIQSPSDSTFQQRSRIYMSGGSSDSISFQASSNNGSTYGERMILTSTGLGIGTSSPAHKLDVNGRIRGSDVGLTSTSNWFYFDNFSGSNFMGLGGGTSLQTYVGGSLRTTLDSSGNLGLGVTPNANWTDYTVFQNQQAAILGYDGQTHYTQNAYYQSGTWKYISASTFPATRYQHSSGIHYWYNATAGAANSAIAWNQGMTLTDATNLLIGTTNNHYSASIIASNAITTNWSSVIGLRYNVSGQTTNYYKGMTGTSIENGAARGLHIFNYDIDSNAGINFYPNSYAGQTAVPAVTIASTGTLTSNYGEITVTGTGSRGVRLRGGGNGEVAIAGDGSTYAIGCAFYNTTSYATTLGGMFAYTSGGAFQYLAIGPSYNSSSSLYVRANGNIGIGFSAAAQKLDVNGALRFTPNPADVNYSADIFANYDSGHPFQINVKNNGTSQEFMGVYADGGGGNERVCFPTGNVLIGATAGSNKLLVVGTGTIGNFSASGLASSATVQIQAANGTGYNARLYMECPGVNSGGLTYTRADSRLYAYSQTDQSGPYVSANGTSWTTNSDRRLKTNIEDIGYGLASVMLLAPKKYNYINNTKKQSLGLIAQDVATVIPEVVDVPENSESMMGIEYQSLVPVLVKAIQEQQAIIELLKARLDAANL